jgi:hypothetical protein
LEQSGDLALVKVRLSGHAKQPFEPKFAKSARKAHVPSHNIYDSKNETLKESNSVSKIFSPTRQQASREKYFTSQIFTLPGPKQGLHTAKV